MGRQHTGKSRTSWRYGGAALIVLAIVSIAAALASRNPAPSSVSSAASPTRIASEALPPSQSLQPSPAPISVPADPCHINGITYCVLNPDVTESTIHSTICVSGWTATIRPPSYTSRLKSQQMTAEHLPGSAADYEEDHRMPLELGGAPTEPSNLSPESHTSSYAKDAAENEGRREVCAGADLPTVQAAFAARWLGPYPTYKS